MRMMKTALRLAALHLVIAQLCHPTTVLGQGSLTPPGPPAAIMKTLDQIEARTPVDAVHTPGCFLAQFIINQPGSYYLTTNLVAVNSKRGIQIEASNVTLDLNGFTVFGNSNAYDAIYYPYAATSNSVVRNGLITGWSSGAAVYYLGRGGLFERLLTSANAVGINCANACVVRNCLISDNAQNGIYIIGAENTVIDNQCSRNNTANSSSSAGINIFGYRNRVEGNHVTASGPAGYGIQVTAYSNNIVVRNFVEGGGTNNYSYNSAQVIGPIITTAPSGVITNSNPWANFAF